MKQVIECTRCRYISFIQREIRRLDNELSKCCGWVDADEIALLSERLTAVNEKLAHAKETPCECITIEQLSLPL
jgi:hypothetical protein